MPCIKDHMETKGHLSKVLDLHNVHLLPSQSDPMNAKYGLSPVFGLSTQTVSTRLADDTQTNDIRPMVHINDSVVNMEAMLVAFITERNLSFSISCKYFCCIQWYFLIAQKLAAFTFTGSKQPSHLL